MITESEAGRGNRSERPRFRTRRPHVVIALALASLAAAGPSRAELFDLESASIADIQAAIDAGALSSVRLVELYLARIEAYDKRGPRLNAVITLNEHALDEAYALDRERELSGRRSALHGIPVVLKDLIDVAGMPTTAGFKPFGAPIPPRDSSVAARLKAAGAIVLAKVSTANWFGRGFDSTHPIGATLNAYDEDYSPGGSSNGPGVAMSANFATIAIGTDTGGSVLIPSAYNSIVGMVATQGLVSRSGIVPRGGTQDRAGPMGRNVADIATALTVIAGWDPEDFVTYQGFGHYPQPAWLDSIRAADLEGRRIGVLREMLSSGAEHEEGRLIFERALQDMRSAGALVVDPVLTGLDLRNLATSAVGRTAEYEKLHVQNAYLSRLGAAAPFASIQQMIETVGRDQFSDLMLAALDLPSPEQSDAYLARRKHRETMIALIADTIDRYALDALVFPFSTLPPPALRGAGGGGGNALASNNGLPSIIVPGGYTRAHLPIGIQFVGRAFDDLAVLEVAFAYERASMRREAPESAPPLPGERFEY